VHWFTHARADTPLREMKIHAEQYGVVLSLLLLPRSADVWPPWAKEDWAAIEVDGSRKVASVQGGQWPVSDLDSASRADTRYDKLAQRFASFVALAAAIIWLAW